MVARPSRGLAAAGVALLVFALGGTASAGRGGGGGGKGSKPDASPPSIAISAPSSGATVHGTIAISGGASDNVGVASVAVSVDGGPFQPAQGTTSWSYGLDTTAYANGSHAVTARAQDAAGNQSLASTAFTVANADTVPPSVTISAPAAGSTVAGSVSVSGTASDPGGGVASVAVSVDGGPAAPATGTGSWARSLDTTSLANGAHTIAATATDLAGNVATVRESISVQNADATPPSVWIASPSAGATLSGAATISGAAADNAQVASVAVGVDGGPFQPAQGTTSWSYGLDTRAYADGAHTISVRATDAAGNASSASVAVTVQNGLPPGVAQQLVTPEGATIQISSDVAGWTAQQVYDLLKANALELSRIGPSLTVKVQTTYGTGTSASASQTNGVYGNYRATMYLQALPGTVFSERPDDVVAHEYGHVWTLYHLYVSHGGDWSSYLSARGILGDPRVDSSFSWSKNEMIADDYRLLFGTSAAQSEAAFLNPDLPDPRSVPGLRDFFLSVWAVP